MPAEINYYDVLGVTIDSTEKEITKAYRKKALACHPDKNPDNPKAAELFHQISEALKILTDEKARAAFDKVLKAKEAARLRTQAFDAKRKKFKDDLEKREFDAQQENESSISAAERLAAEIKRLREEGSRLVREQQELLVKQLAEEKKKKSNEEITPKLKVKWKASKRDHQNGGYTEQVLRDCFQKYGTITCIVLSIKKNGLAIIEYETVLQANMALEFERGLPDNPCTVYWLEGGNKTNDGNTESNSKKQHDNKTTVHPPSTEKTQDVTSNTDFESIVLMRMRQAEERKRLTKELLEQDSRTDTGTT